jgi:hypothetical protein
VLKLYPSRLHIAITERDAFALWQRDGKVEVIAEDGTVVEPYAGQHFAKLPLVVGVGAETRAKDDLRRDSYFHRIALAHHELAVNNLKRALELLGDCPEAEVGGRSTRGQARPRQQGSQPRHRRDRSAAAGPRHRAVIG